MDPRRITGPHAWENPTDQVAVPFRGALASRLIAKHRGVRWQIAQAFGAEEGGANAEAGDLARRRLESNAWVPWSARGGRETPNRGVSEQPPATRLPSRAGEAPCSSRVGRETPGRAGPPSGRAGVERPLRATSPCGALEACLADSDERVRWRAARGLAALGAAAAPHAAPAAARLEDVDSTVRWAADDTLSRMELGRGGPKEAQHFSLRPASRGGQPRQQQGRELLHSARGGGGTSRGGAP
uniref:Uncharacterized protein n=1 Tax=Alexandrium monilatum TaxID=311494 RepID=A0A7S4V1X4_9DINO|mmetsp:Transcript_36287/g.112885  ORF Transcript_36287/g.112885 Transcript_36287/m.112885 type:complete len:242 (-) Transcript_36287:34-759(-)